MGVEEPRSSQQIGSLSLVLLSAACQWRRWPLMQPTWVSIGLDAPASDAAMSDYISPTALLVRRVTLDGPVDWNHEAATALGLPLSMTLVAAHFHRRISLNSVANSA